MHATSFSIASALFLAFGAASVEAQGFVDVTPSSGLTGHAPSVHDLGTGVCAADFDGDGDQDVIAGNNSGQPFLSFENLGAMTFVDRSAASGLGQSSITRGCFAADVDNDGDQDLCVRNRHTGTLLFLNDGDAQFSESAVPRGVIDNEVVDGFSATFGDYDLDGELDLYLGNRTSLTSLTGPNQLLRNTGGGHFEDVTASASVDGGGLTFVAAFWDYDEDGWPDLFCANDKGYTADPNTLYRNNGDGTFWDLSLLTNTYHGIDGMGFDFVDAFNDGGVDFFVTDSPTDHLFQVWDPVLGMYGVDQSTFGILTSPSSVGWACHFFDYDNDRWPDLHVVHYDRPNDLYHNPGAPASALLPWIELAAFEGVDVTHPQQAAVLADFDDDGRVDILNRYRISGSFPALEGFGLLRNTGVSGNWLKVRTRGKTSNRDGLGTRVRLQAGGVVQTQSVRNGVGFLGSSDPRVHFGLGTSMLATLELTWPSGLVQRIENVDANQQLEVVEPSYTYSGTATLGSLGTVQLEAPLDAGLLYFMTVALGTTPGTPLDDGRSIPVNLDAIALLSLSPGNALLPASVGILPAFGSASSPLQVPLLPALAGQTVYTTAVTMQPGGDFVTVFPRAVPLTLQ